METRTIVNPTYCVFIVTVGWKFVLSFLESKLRISKKKFWKSFCLSVKIFEWKLGSKNLIIFVKTQKLCCRVWGAYRKKKNLDLVFGTCLGSQLGFKIWKFSMYFLLWEWLIYAVVMCSSKSSSILSIYLILLFYFIYFIFWGNIMREGKVCYHGGRAVHYAVC